MIIFNPKPPGETVAYTIDWRGELGEDAIATSNVTASGSATIVEQGNACGIVTVLIAGGTNETTTTFTNNITTRAGQILSRTATLYVVDGSVPASPSTTTKRLPIDMAFQEIRLAGYEFDIDPVMLDSALTKLDLLMAEWAVSGINLSYNAPRVPGQGNLEDEIGIPNAALQAVSLYLAQRISPDYGKALSIETKASMAQAMANLRAMALTVPHMRFPANTPIGAGSQRSYWWGPFAGYGRRC